MLVHIPLLFVLFCTNLCFVVKNKIKEKLIETTTLNWNEYPSDYYVEWRRARDLAYNDAILAQNEFHSQLEVLTKQRQYLSHLNAIQVSFLACEFCRGGHQSEHCAHLVMAIKSEHK